MAAGDRGVGLTAAIAAPDGSWLERASGDDPVASPSTHFWPAAAFSLIYFLIILLLCFILYNWMQRVGTVSDEGAGHE